MADSNFIDHVKLCSRSGPGGAGSAHFRREKFIPKGGPDGGNGGRGGHIILRVNSQLWTLLHLKYRKHVIAEKGAPGEGGNRSGKDGGDIILEVPLGTVAKVAETGEIRFEITEEGEEKNPLPLEVEAVLATITLKHPHGKPHIMRNQVNLELRNGLYLN